MHISVFSITAFSQREQGISCLMFCKVKWMAHSSAVVCATDLRSFRKPTVTFAINNMLSIQLCSLRRTLFIHPNSTVGVALLTQALSNKPQEKIAVAVVNIL